MEKKNNDENANTRAANAPALSSRRQFLKGLTTGTVAIGAITQSGCEKPFGRSKQMNLHNFISGIALVALVPVGSNVLAADAQADKAIFEKSCVSCHGKDGKGNPAMAKVLGEKGLNLTAKETSQKSDPQLMKVIEDGEGKMPPFKSLSKDELKQVVAYIRSLAK